ncbi:MAG: lysophospholipid acyltransferase family protein [Oscillospiraceae bacterium]|nr:lysophospholipid acyltransferase family protein [Oscillospiraceae bacterium]
MSQKKKNPRRGYLFRCVTVNTLLNLLKKKYMTENNVTLEVRKPEHKAFLLIANHTEAADPGYEMVATKRYLRFVASDHTLRMKMGWVFKYIGGVIVKHRERPSSELTSEIIDNLKAGIPVGLHAEGAMSVNGQTGFVSEHTGQLVKDSGAALVTYRFVGGYLRKPRWAESPRKGPIKGEFVAEYSPEELAKLSVHEITELIRRDIYVNAYERQRENPEDYSGDNLAECVERVLYLCPECGKVGTLHSHGNFLECDCGYKVEMQSDGFFHDTGKGLHYDNVLDWDMWQRARWKERVLAAAEGELIFSEENMTVRTVGDEGDTVLTEKGKLSLCQDRFEVDLGDGSEVCVIPMKEVKQVSLAGKEALLLVGGGHYFDIRPARPASPNKYIAAWRYLTGREYY